jgi:hypothetical protein
MTTPHFIQHIRQQNNLGLVTHEEATIEQNRIRYGLLELLDDLEQNGTHPASFDALLAAVEQESTRPEVQAEVANAISIVNSKNVVVGSTITAGGNVHIGDKTTQIIQNAEKIYNINHIDNANFD